MLGCRHSTSESKWVYVDKLISIDDIRSTPNLTLCLKQDQKDLLNLPLYRAMYFYIVMCSL